MIPALVDAPPEGDDWIHEIKHDGYRTQIVIGETGARAFTRRGANWTDKYRPVVAAAGELRTKAAIIDGEMVVMDENGESDYHLLRWTLTRAPGRMVLTAFDLLFRNGKDLRALETVERRAALQKLMVGAPPAIQFSDAIAGGGKAFFAAVEQMGLGRRRVEEARAAYIGGQTRAWLKAKSYTFSELEVAGVLAERGKATVTEPSKPPALRR